MTRNSPSSRAALHHLNRIKPTDGWNIIETTDGDGVKLLRRNVPLTENSFLDIHYDQDGSKCVVGVLTQDGSTCQVLVDPHGKPYTGRVKIISCTKSYPVKTTSSSSSSRTTTRSTTNANQTTTATNNTTPGMFTDAASWLGLDSLSPTERQAMELYIKYALMAMIALVILRALAVSSIVSVAILPLLYLYGVSTCPSMDSFDAKKELKRVLRGTHLPEDHPNKPKGMLEEWAARITASVTTELATFPGYEIDMLPVAGALIWTEVKVPTANLLCYWVGANHRWYYIGSRELNPSTTTTNPPGGTNNNNMSFRPHQD